MPSQISDRERQPWLQAGPSYETKTYEQVIAQLADAVDLLQELIPPAFVGDEFGVAHAGDAALLRLVTGRASPKDSSLLSIPINGSRVVCLVGSATSVDQLLAALADVRRCSAARYDDTTVVVLIREFPSRTSDPARSESSRLVSSLRRSYRVRAGISAALQDVDEIQGAFADALEAASVGSPDGAPVFAEDVWASLTLRRLQRVLSGLMSTATPVERLSRYDERNRTELRRTLAVWLRHDRATAESAREMHVHPNTLRYRLHRAQHIAGIDLSDREQCLVLELLLNAH